MILIHRLLIVFFLTMTAVAGMASAEEGSPVAAPSVPVPEAQETAGPEKEIMFLQLFSAERCPFCPQAERNMNDILSDPDILGFTCMVDYFDAGTKGGLSQSFCAAEQSLYIRMLKSGSRYTPQMVLNGRVQFPGYSFQKTAEAIGQEREDAHVVKPLLIRQGDEAGIYDVILPQLNAKTDAPAPAVTPVEAQEDYVLRVVMIRKTPFLAIGEGTRHVREQLPHNVAVAIRDGGFWNGQRTVWSVTPPTDQLADAFLVVVQDRKTGAVMAAGQSDLPAGPAHGTD